MQMPGNTKPQETPDLPGILAFQIERGKRKLLKLTASLLTLTFTFTQITFAHEAIPYGPESPRPQKRMAQEQGTSPEDSKSASLSSHEFLSETLSLEPPHSEGEGSFEYLRELIREDFAAAVPIGHLTAEKLNWLRRHAPVEGMLVKAYGKGFVISSGHIHEIQTYAEIRRLLEEASREKDFLMAHWHPEETESPDPSYLDLLEAGPNLRYLLTPAGILSYNGQGALERNISEGDFLASWNEGMDEGDEERARDWANRLVVAMDRLNEADLERETLLASGTVTPDPTLTSSNLTNFSGSPWTLLMAGSSTPTSIIQQSSTQFQINYDVTGAGSESGAWVSFDNPTTSAVEVRNLLSFTDFVVGVRGPAGAKARFRVEDSLGTLAEVDLVNLSTSMQYYKISKTLLPGIDWTKVKRFIYSIDASRTPTLTGTLTIQTKTLLYSTTALTNLPASPKLELAQGSSVGTVLRQYGTASFALDFSLPASGDKSAAMINFDNASTTPVESQNLSSLTQFVFSASASSSSAGKVKVAMTDASGAEASTVLSWLTTTTQYYVLPAALFTIDRTKVRSITFTIDTTLTTLTSGSLYVGAKTLLHNMTLATNLISKPNPVVLEGSSAGTFLTEPSGTQMKLNLDLTAVGSWSAMSFRFDNPATTAQETQDLSQGDAFVFGFQGGSSYVTKVRLEVRDKNGNVASKILPINTGTTYITVQKSLLTGIDWTSLTSIDFIVDRSYVTSSSAYKSYVHINANNFLYTPTVVSSSGLTSANISTLAGSPSLFLLPGSSAPTALTEGTNQFTLSYDLAAAATFSGARINYDKPATPGLETVNLSATSNLIFGASSSSNTVRMTMVDSTGAKASVLLAGVAATEKYFQVNLSSFSGIDKTKITEILFEIEPVVATNAPKTGSVTISTKGLASASLAAPGLDASPSLTSQSVQTFSGTKERGTGIVVGGVMALPPDDATTWSLAVDLPLEGENVFNFQETTGAGVSGLAVEIRITRDTVAPVGSVVMNGGDTYTLSSDITLTLTASDATSGVDQMRFSTDGGNTWSAWEAFAQTKTLTLPAGDGTKEVRCELRDKAGLLSSISDTIILDTVLPQGTILVNGGASYVTGLQVSLNLSAADETSGVSQMSFSTDGLSYKTPEPYSTLKTWSFALGDGNKTVWVKFQDQAGNWSESASATVLLDMTRPTGSLDINFGQGFTNASQVTLNLSAEDAGSGIESISFSSDYLNWTAPEAFSAAKDWTLEAGEDIKKAYVRYFDKAGNVSKTYAKSILLDETAPAGSVLIQDGALYTASADVTLTLAGSDSVSGLGEMRFSTDGGTSWSVWEGFQATKSLTLPSGDGTKTVLYELRDRAGNVSSFTDSILLDSLSSFEESSGLLVIEAEHPSANIARNTKSWSQQTTQTGFSAEGYFYAGPDTGVIQNTGYVTASPELQYPVYIQSPGTYYVWVRGYAKDGNSDSLHVGIDGAGPSSSDRISSSAYGSYSWTKNTMDGVRASVTISTAGFHTLNVWMREDGFIFDKILLTKDSAYTPAGTGPSESARHDTAPPTGSIAINQDDAHTTSPDVSLSLGAQDSGSGLDGMRFSTDGGMSWSNWEAIASSKNMTLPGRGGLKEIRYQVRDKAGNVWAATDTITYDPILQDGTEFFYEGNTLLRELTPEGDQIFYRADGSVEKYRYSDGREIRYATIAPYAIEIYDAAGTLAQSIDRPVATPLDESRALKLSLDGGIEAFYVGGLLKELRTATGIRVTDFTLNSANEIQNALIIYPDRMLEVIRDGILLRRIYPDGSVMDFTPKDYAVREISAARTEYYRFDKISQSKAQETLVFTSDGASSRYDELGILREVTSAQGERFLYSRSSGTDAYTSDLIRAMSSQPSPQALGRGSYDLQGLIQELTLEDGTKIVFEAGRISVVLDPAGNPVSDYSYLQNATFLQGLSVSHSGTQFLYDGAGFLEKVVTAGGTVTRQAVDTDNDGLLTDETVVDLLLETVGGDTLKDFELDSQGNIIKGIIETKEGIKQRIENGALTGFETVDGRIYDFAANEATLREWHFRDGTRVIYGEAVPEGGGGGSVTEILFPDQRRLHTIGFSAGGGSASGGDSKKQVTFFTEELPDGTKKFFNTLDGQSTLTKLITPTGAEIHYGRDGLAGRIILPDLSEEAVSYVRNESGQIEEIVFQGLATRHSYRPDGTLLSLLSKGASAEIASGEVSRIFTRFGEIASPAFDPNGILSGEVVFQDGTRQVIEAGALIQTIRSNGTKVNYAAGRIESIERGAEIYRFIEQKDLNGNVTDIRIRLESKEGAPEFPLIPFLETPDTLYDFATGGYVPPYPVTFHGDAALDTTDYRFGTGSAYFDGSLDYLSIPDSDDFDFGTGDFTVDFNVNFETFLGGNHTFFTHNAGNHEFNITYNNNNSTLNLFLQGTNIYRTWNPSFNTWYHLAFVRSGSEVRMFVDGVQLGLATTNTADVSAAAEVRIGSGFNSSEFFQGGIDELRVSKGLARWTQNFTPASDSYRTDPETKLLLHLDPPKEGPTELSLASKELSEILLPRPLHNSFGDRFKIRSELKSNTSARAAGAHSFALAGNVFRDTAQVKLGESSASFDGDGDFIYSADSPDWHFGAGDFTIDFWTRFDSLGQDQGFIGQDPGLDDWWSFYWKTDNTIRFETETGGVTDHNLSWNWTPSANAWYHVALVKQGGSWRVAIDGKSLGERTDNAPVADYGDNLRLGRIRYQGGGSLAHLAGSLDEFRISKGLARWTSDFTPPAGEYEQDTDTSLLLHFSQSEFDSGAETPPFALSSEEPGQELFFANLALDPERGEAAEFGSDYLPEWLNVSLNRTGLDQGYIAHDIVTGGEWDDLPSTTTTLADLNGDGLEDRVFVNPSSDSWWVQMNTGQGFQDAVRWNGVQGLGSWDKERYVRFFIGRSPQEYGALVDIDGDGRPDRVLQKQTGEPEWYVQFNNGSGFDPITLWSDRVQELSIYAAHGHFASKARDNSYLKDIQEVVADLIDMDGDGLPDRVVRPFTGPYERWFFQKNLGKGQGFADTVLWKGVDPGFYSGDEQMGASLSWYTYAGSPGDVADLSDLVDLTGDGLPDRVLLKNKDSADPNSAVDWYIQKNNGGGAVVADGSGFDSAVLWDEDVRIAPGLASARIATAIRVFKGWNAPRDVVIDLQDVTGDGLVDRVSMDGTNGAQHTSWWVEENTGAGFAPAVEWTGIEGTSTGETSITQDNENFHSQNPPGSTPSSVKKVSDLQDMNGDGILDRVIFPEGTSSWKIQFGTGSGFLPAEEMKIASVAASANQIRSLRYDYLHVSLKSASPVPASAGSVRVSLSDPENPDALQEWLVSDLATSWKDLYLPIDPAKPSASEVKVSAEGGSASGGKFPAIPIYIDNVTFTRLRPPAVKDWLDRVLTEENVLTEIHSKRTETLAQYLGLTQADSTTPFDFNQLLNAETRIHFDAAGEADEFQTFYGSVSQIQNGQVAETILPDGTKIEFTAPDPNIPNILSQTVTKTDGAVETNDLSYGRVRSVSRPSGSPLQYSYEFSAEGGSASGGDASGREITVVFDPDSNITERYAENLLISRTLANGVTHSFKYSTDGTIARTTISYKGRIRAAFDHGTTSSGNKTLTTEAGVIEEYAPDGTILFHTTPEGYRYAHTFERARKAVTTVTTETVTLPDESTFTVDVPKVTLGDCDPALETCEDVHRVTLTAYDVSKTGEYAEYGDVTVKMEKSEQVDSPLLKSLLLADGSRLAFERIERIEHFDSETGQSTTETKLLDATVFHPDGTVTEYRDGKPFSVTTATGRVISLATEDGLLINPSESAEFHHAQALKLWEELVHPKWQEFQAPGTLPVAMEYHPADGKLISRQFAEGVIELYGSDGKIDQVLARTGELLIQYSYDAEGNPTKIEMGAARRRLEATILKLKAEIAVEREKALARVADREQVLNQTIEGQYVTARDRLLALRAQIEAQAAQVASITVKGKVAKRVIGSAVGQIQAGLDQVNQALEQLARQRADALAELASQVAQANTQIETETENSYLQIETENKKARDQILRQEISPIVYHWYRKILGRDPSSAEYSAVIASADYASGTFDLEGLKSSLLSSQELADRSSQVAAIKSAVQNELLNYLTLSESDQIAFAVSLGILPEERISLSSSEANAILDWLNARSLHFGQSAYLALEALLTDSGIAFNRVELATKLILIDILTGTLTPLEEDELVISLYAMKRVAAGYSAAVPEGGGLQVEAYGMTFDALKAMYSEAVVADGDAACSDPTNCNFRFVAHINGNHFVIVTQVTDTQVTYIDPGAGPENSLDQVTISKEEFLEVWRDQTHSAWGQNAGMGPQSFGFVLSARAPPQIQNQIPSSFVLSTSQSQEIRGAFFFLLIFAFIAIVQAIASAVAAVVSAIVGLISTLVSAIGSVLSGIGSFLQGFFGPIFEGIHAGFGAVMKGLGALGHAFSSLHGALLGGIQGFAGSLPFIGPALSSLVGTSAFSNMLALGMIGFGIQGTGILLEKMGLSPKITQTLIAGGKIAIGVGLLATGNPLGLAASLGFVSGGTGELLNLHTSLSPAITNIISIGATALGAFAGGFIDTGSLTGALSGLTSALPHLLMDLSSAGLTALGSTLGLDARLTALISVPVRASVGAITGNALGLPGYKDVLGNITSQTLGGLVSVGSSIGLDAIGAPSVLQSFIPGMLGQLAASATGSTGGGGGGPGDPTPQEQGQNIFKRMMENLVKFGKTVVTTAGDVVSFGQKVFEGGVNLARQGLAKAADLFSGLFNRKTVENLSHNGQITIENKILTNGNFTQDGDLFSWETDFGGETVQISHLGNGQYQIAEGNTSKSFSDLFMDNFGSLGGAGITIGETLSDGLRWSQVFDFDEASGRNEVKEINLLKTSGSLEEELLAIRPYEHRPLSFENDVLMTGRVTGMSGLDVAFLDGKIDHLNLDPFETFGIESVGPSNLLFDFDRITGSDNYGVKLNSGLITEPSGNELARGTYEEARSVISERAPADIANRILSDLDRFIAEHGGAAPQIELITETRPKVLLSIGSVVVTHSISDSLTYGNSSSPVTLKVDLNTGTISGISAKGTLPFGGEVKPEIFVGIKNDSVVVGSGELGLKTCSIFSCNSYSVESDPWFNATVVYENAQNIGANGQLTNTIEIKGNIDELSKIAAGSVILAGGGIALAALLITKSAPAQAVAVAAAATAAGITLNDDNQQS